MRLHHIFVLASCSVAVWTAEKCDGAGKACAVAYRHKQCGPDKYLLGNDLEIKDLAAGGFDNAIKSVVVSKHCGLFLYDKKDFEGDFRILLGNMDSEQYHLLDDKMSGAASSAVCDCNIESIRKIMRP